MVSYTNTSNLLGHSEEKVVICRAAIPVNETRLLRPSRLHRTNLAPHDFVELGCWFYCNRSFHWICFSNNTTIIDMLNNHDMYIIYYDSHKYVIKHQIMSIRAKNNAHIVCTSPAFGPAFPSAPPLRPCDLFEWGCQKICHKRSQGTHSGRDHPASQCTNVVTQYWLHYCVVRVKNVHKSVYDNNITKNKFNGAVKMYEPS